VKLAVDEGAEADKLCLGALAAGKPELNAELQPRYLAFKIGHAAHLPLLRANDAFGPNCSGNEAEVENQPAGDDEFNSVHRTAFSRRPLETSALPMPDSGDAKGKEKC
jgi:hypothetical protein